MSTVTPASAAGMPTMRLMAVRYPRRASRAWRQLPEPAQTARGMMDTMTASAAKVLRKVITWR